MNVATIAFVYNFPCPLQCDFCCHTKENVGPGRFKPENVIPIVIDFSKQEGVRRFAFTGGDPFIYRREIISIMKAARESGVTQPFHIVTSGYWAKSKAATYAALEELKSLGMDLLYVSFDREHARWVSAEQVNWIVDSCGELGIRIEVCGVFWGQDEKVEDLISLPDFVKTHSSLVFSMGKARQIYGNGPRYQISNSLKGTCGKASNYDVTIYPNGDVYPCCSGGFNKEAGLNCGNAFSDPAEHILRRVFTDFHVRVAKEVDFRKLYELVEREDNALFQKLTPFDKVDTVCEICRDLHGNEALRKAIEPYYEQMEVQYVMDELDRHAAVMNLA